MDLSQKHLDARAEQCRLPALQASLALLVRDTQAAAIELYATARPAPGGAAGGMPVAVVLLSEAPGSINTTLKRIELTVPLDGQVTGADSALGSSPTWARISDGAGAWWADCSVSDLAGAGEIQLTQLPLYNGSTVRITAANFQG